MPYADPEKRKAYAAKHYQDNIEGYEKRRVEYRRALRDYVDDLKRKPCVDCAGTFEPCQMQFDHIGTDKVASVSQMVRGKGRAFVDAEIAKCELVCANCHALRTHRRRRL